MSVGLYRYSGDINDKNTELIFSEIYHLRFSINVIGLRQYVNPKLNCLKMDAILMWAI